MMSLDDDIMGNIWERVNSLMNIECDSEPIYGDNDKCIKAKKKVIWR